MYMYIPKSANLHMFCVLSSAGFAEVEKKKPGPKKVKKEEPAVEDDVGTASSPVVVKTVDRWTESLLSSTSLSQVSTA